MERLLLLLLSVCPFPALQEKQATLSEQVPYKEIELVKKNSMCLSAKTFAFASPFLERVVGITPVATADGTWGVEPQEYERVCA